MFSALLSPPLRWSSVLHDCLIVRYEISVFTLGADHIKCQKKVAAAQTFIPNVTICLRLALTFTESSQNVWLKDKLLSSCILFCLYLSLMCTECRIYSLQRAWVVSYMEDKNRPFFLRFAQTADWEASGSVWFIRGNSFLRLLVHFEYECCLIDISVGKAEEKRLSMAVSGNLCKSLLLN